MPRYRNSPRQVFGNRRALLTLGLTIPPEPLVMRAVPRTLSAMSFMTPRRWTVLLILLAAFIYLVGNHRVGLWDRDEPRYYQTSRQMLNSDPPNWVVPRYWDQVRTAKPVFIYWCQALGMRLAGETEFGARLPSAVAMVGTLCVLAFALGRHLGALTALVTVFVFATSGLVIAAAKMCITDSVLLLWITIAQLCLFAIYSGQRGWGVVLGMWLAVGLAGLTKGPVVLAIQIATVLILAALDIGRNWRSLAAWKNALRWLTHTRPLLGLLLIIVIVGPWLVAIQLQQPDFLRTTLWHDVFTRSVKPLEGHKGPPGFHFAFIWGTFFPWSVLLPTAATIAWKHRGEPATRFAMAAVIGPWIVMECVQTKLVHYMLPAFPPLAFLTADAILRCIRREHDDLHRPIVKPVMAVWALLVAAAGSTTWLALRHFTVSQALVYAGALLSLVGLAYGLAVFAAFAAQRLRVATALLGLGMFAVVLTLYGLYLPNADFLWVPRRVADILKAGGAAGPLMMIDFKEDSLPVYVGRPMQPGSDYFLVKTPPAEWPAWITLTRPIYDRLPEERRARLEIVGTVRGWAYADSGRIVEVLVARKKPS